ncbi:hypothetical protein, partial [Burkholderia cenocepacia]|uniref:hypothetical protein n=1 Tax=Burkholderia cenocepacia TaxID=95486 RepID=UPI001CF5A456
LKSQAVIPLRPLDPLLHLPPLRLGEKVSTYFRMGQAQEKSRWRLRANGFLSDRMTFGQSTIRIE